MRYQGPIYRPPSEADSLLIQATAGCPHNKCTFCMVYKNGPKFKVRPKAEIIEDMHAAREQYGSSVRTMFLPAGNSIAVPTEDLVHICQAASEIFPLLERITVYGSARYILDKGEDELRRLAESGLSRIHRDAGHWRQRTDPEACPGHGLSCKCHQPGLCLDSDFFAQNRYTFAQKD